MSEPRKIFRIEETAAARLASGFEDTQAALRHAEIMRELKALRAALGDTTPAQRPNEPKPQDPEAERLTSELHLIYDALSGAKGAAAGPDTGPASLAPINRIAHELTPW